MLTIGLVSASSTPVQMSTAPLAAVLLLRHHDRLVLAPLYGASLLLAGELAQRSLELRGRERVGSGVISSRLAVVVSLAALGGCASALAALAVTIAPGRSIAFTAIGTVTVVVVFVAITVLGRRQGHASANEAVPGAEAPPAPGPDG